MTLRFDLHPRTFSRLNFRSRSDAISIHILRYKPAIKFGKTAFERFGELGCQLGQGMVKDAMGRVYIVMDKPDKAGWPL